MRHADYSRRDALGLMAAAGGLAAVQPTAPIGRSWSIEDVVARNDTAVGELLKSQISVEICFREGGELEGCTPLPGSADAFLLERGTGVFRSGRNEVRFGPGSAPHRYVQLRGAEPKLSGQSVYITGYTPFEHVLTIECR